MRNVKGPHDVDIRLYITFQRVDIFCRNDGGNETATVIVRSESRAEIMSNVAQLSDAISCARSSNTAALWIRLLKPPYGFLYCCIRGDLSDAQCALRTLKLFISMRNETDAERR